MWPSGGPSYPSLYRTVQWAYYPTALLRPQMPLLCGHLAARLTPVSIEPSNGPTIPPRCCVPRRLWPAFTQKSCNAPIYNWILHELTCFLSALHTSMLIPRFYPLAPCIHVHLFMTHRHVINYTIHITFNSWVPISTVPHDPHMIRVDIVIIFIGIAPLLLPLCPKQSPLRCSLSSSIRTASHHLWIQHQVLFSLPMTIRFSPIFGFSIGSLLPPITIT